MRLDIANGWEVKCLRHLGGSLRCFSPNEGDSVCLLSKPRLTDVIEAFNLSASQASSALATTSCAGWVWCWLLPNASRIPNSGSAQTVWELSCSVHGGNGWKQPLLMCCSPFFISVIREVVLAHHVSNLPQEKEFCMSLWGCKVSWPLYRTELDGGTSHATTGIFWLGFPWITYCL